MMEGTSLPKTSGRSIIVRPESHSTRRQDFAGSTPERGTRFSKGAGEMMGPDAKVIGGKLTPLNLQVKKLWRDLIRRGMISGRAQNLRELIGGTNASGGT